MHKTHKKVAACIFSALIFYGTSSAALAQIKSDDVLIACFPMAEALTTKNPFELWRSLPTCALEGKDEQAIFMYGLAGSIGIFDSMRIKDQTAYQVMRILPMAGMMAMGKQQGEAFQDKVKAHFGDAANRARLCRKFKSLSPPSYFPGYMISHGMGSIDGPLVEGFNPTESWPKAVDAYMQCPKD